MIGSVVDEVLKEIGNAANEGMKTADDYMDTETGLLMCGRCHTKKQKKISFLGVERVVGCLCQCAAEEMEREREKHRAEEELLHIRQMKSAGLQDSTSLITRLQTVMKRTFAPNMHAVMWGILQNFRKTGRGYCSGAM